MYNLLHHSHTNYTSALSSPSSSALPRQGLSYSILTNTNTTNASGVRYAIITLLYVDEMKSKGKKG